MYRSRRLSKVVVVLLALVVALLATAITLAQDATLTITPDTGPQGTTFSVAIAGAEPGASIDIAVLYSRTGKSVYSTSQTAADDGTLSFDLYSGSDDAPGLYVVSASASGTVFAQGTFTIEGEAPAAAVSISVAPQSAALGSTQMVTVTGAAANADVTVSFTLDGSEVFSTTHTADSSGSVSFPVSSSASDSTGTYTVTASVNDQTIATTEMTLTEAPRNITVDVSPTTGMAPTDYTITVSGLNPDEVVFISVGGAGGAALYSGRQQADANGNVTVTVSSSDSSTAGDYTVDVRSGATSLAQATLTVQGPETTPEPIAAEMTIDPPAGPNGTSHTITVTGLPAGADVTLDFAFNGQSVFSDSATADDSGTATYNVRSDSSDAQGDYTVTATVNGQEVASATMTITGAQAQQQSGVTVSVDPAEGPRGTTHTITISGLDPNSTVTLDYKFGGSSVFTTSATADDSGTVITTIVSEQSDALGSYEIDVVGSDGTQLASGTFSITEAAAPSAVQMTVEPAEGPRGTNHVITVTGLDPNSTVTLDFQFNGSSVYSTDITADSTGTASTSIVSEQSDALGTYDIRVLGSNNEPLASGSFTVTGGQSAGGSATMTISPASGEQGTNHTITVTGLQPGQAVTFDISFQGSSVYTADRTAADDGSAQLTIFTENTDSPGDYTITATVGGQVVASGTLTVVAAGPPVLGGGEAQGTDITVGQQVTGQLTSDSPTATYRFTGHAGDSVDITLESADFDSYLLLEDANGTVLTEDDDSAGRLNSQISGYTLPADGTYLIVATSLPYQRSNGDRFATGSFTLSFGGGVAQGGGGEVQTNVPYDAVIQIGGTASDMLSASTPSLTYAFVGQAGQAVIISLSSPDFDTYLTLEDASGYEITSDDDGGDGLNSLIGPYVLPDSGTYLIVAESFGAHTAGDAGYGSFDLSVNAVVPQTIEYSQTVQSTIDTTQPVQIYTFTGQAGDVVSISVNTSSFYSNVSLSESSSPDYPLASDDAYYGNSGQYGSQIGPFTLPDSGEYMIKVGGDTSSGSGDFSMRLDRVTLSSISYGDTLQVDLSPDNPAAYYSFEGHSGDIITVTVISNGTIDTNLTLTPPSNYDRVYDDDGGPGFDPELFQVTLSEDGTYVLTLASTANESGTVTLSLSSTPAPSLDQGPQRVRLSDKQTQGAVVFNGTAGETVRLVVDVVSGSSFVQPSIQVLQNGQNVASGNVSGSSRMSFDFTVPQSGEVRIIVEDYSQSGAVLELSLERNP